MKPVHHDSDLRKIQGLDFRTGQLERRPAPEIPDVTSVVIQLKIVGDDVVVAVGDAQFYLAITEDMDGMDLVACAIWLSTPSSSGAVTVMIRNATQGADMLSTALTIDSGELNSKDAATPAVINTGVDDVAWADEIRIDVDGAGTGARGLGVDLRFALP